MAAPNQLIINGTVVVSPLLDHNGRNFVATGGFSVANGTSSVSKDDIVSLRVTATDKVTANNGTFTGALASQGTLAANAVTIATSLSAGNTVFNGTVTLGSILLQNGQIKVLNSFVTDNSITTPYANLVNAAVTATLTANNFVALRADFNGDSWQNVGNRVQKANTALTWRNPANTQNAAAMSVDANGLFSVAIYNNDGTLKNTLFKTSTSTSNTDPNLTIGVGTITSGSSTYGADLTVNGAFRVKGATTFDGTLNVSSLTVTGAVDAGSVTMRNDSRVMRASNNTQGALLFGNGSQAIIWDGANWVVRGGAFYASNFVADANLTVLGSSNPRGPVLADSTITANGEIYSATSLRSPSLISEGGSIRSRGTDGNIAAGRVFFGNSDASITCDNASFYINRNVNLNGQSLTAGQGVFNNGLYVRGPGTSGTATMWFGVNNQYSLNYDNGNTLQASGDFRAAGNFATPNGMIAGTDVSANRFIGNALISNGNITGAYISSSGSVNATTSLTTAGIVDASGTVFAGNLHSRASLYVATNASIVGTVSASGGARFANEVWVDNGGNFSRLVFGQGRALQDWDGGKFSFSNTIYSAGNLIAENDLFAYGAVRGGRFGGGDHCFALRGDGNGNAILDIAGGTLSTGNINAGYVRGSSTGYFGQWNNPGENACIMLTGDSGGNGIINTGNQALFIQNAYAYGYYNRSDERLKDITPFMSDSKALDKVLQFNPVVFTWKDEKMDRDLHYGFSAQALEAVDDVLVMDSTIGVKHVASLEMLPLLVASIKELKREIEELKSRR